MDHRITQCPRCGTSFRVTEAHLAVAGGAVRCGSCLHIFNAREHWLEAAPAAVPTPEPELTPQRLEDLDIDDDALFDDDTPIFIGDDEPPQETKGGVIFNPVDDDFEAIDDSGPETLSDTFLEINSWEEDTGHSFGNAGNDDPDLSAEEQEWTRKLLEDDDKDDQTSDLPQRPSLFEEYGDILDDVPEIDDAAPVSLDGAIDLSPEFLDVDSGRDNRSDTVEAAAVTAPISNQEIELESLHPGRPLDSDLQRNPLFDLDRIESAPLRPHQFVNEPRWPRALWGIGFVAALALLLAQYIYFNFSDLARGELRPWLARACEIAGCVLPPQSDPAQVRTTSLIVRSHPTARGALAVDAIITNQADFPQPYPPLQLQFTDLNGAPVAGRRFSPDEYLSGELKGARLMPVRQPVHIALELLDPGSRAVNYLLTVVPTNSRAH